MNEKKNKFNKCMNSIIVLEIVSGDDNICLNSINVTFELFFLLLS